MPVDPLAQRFAGLRIAGDRRGDPGEGPSEGRGGGRENKRTASEPQLLVSAGLESGYAPLQRLPAHIDAQRLSSAGLRYASIGAHGRSNEEELPRADDMRTPAYLVALFASQDEVDACAGAADQIFCPTQVGEDYGVLARPPLVTPKRSQKFIFDRHAAA